MPDRIKTDAEVLDLIAALHLDDISHDHPNDALGSIAFLVSQTGREINEGEAQ